jgi:Alternative complex III, ActD subunit
MSQEIRLIGSFPDDERCAHGIEKLKEVKAKWHAYSPIPSEKIAEVIGLGRSPVRRFVLAGGIFGALSGLAVTIGTSLEWNLVAGGKPIVSLPPFLIITFELMILCGGIGGVLGFFLNNRMPVFEPKPGYSPTFSGDRFGLIVECDEADSEGFESLLREAGAEEVTRETA